MLTPFLAFTDRRQLSNRCLGEFLTTVTQHGGEAAQIGSIFEPRAAM
jgi:hypothetical protein